MDTINWKNKMDEYKIYLPKIAKLKKKLTEMTGWHHNLKHFW